MNQETFNRNYENDLTPKQRNVLSLYLDGHTDDDIIKILDDMVKKTKPSDRTLVTNHLKNICKKFCIYPENDTGYRYTLVELFWKYKPEIVSPKRLKLNGYIDVEKPPCPDSPLRANSPFYIERPPIELECYNRLAEVGTLLRIKSPHKMGKTSLIGKIIAEANQKKYHTVVLDLSLIEGVKFNNTEQFLLSFYNYIIQEFPTVPPLQKWDANTSATINCTKDFQNLLKHLDKVLVLVLDEVDKIFEYPEIYRDFFPMLRHWYEKANISEAWENLRLVISHSTDEYGRLDINQSPFNVGYLIKLEEFTTEQIKNLASRHGLNRDSILPLIDIVEGHPYLLRLAFYNLYYQRFTFQQLIQESSTDIGIYKHHLFCLLKILQNNQELKEVFKKIITQNHHIDLKEKTIQMYQLESMGLIKFEHNSVKVRCKLYHQYFCDRL